ncbi:MAG: sensor histidine kinase [Gemmatimonadaceae bacterium]
MLLSPAVPVRRPRWLLVLAYLAGWAALALFFASQGMIYSAYQAQPVAWGVTVGRALVDWYIWAALAPLVYLLARRFPLVRGHLPSALAVHAGAGALFAVARIATRVALADLVPWLPSAPFRLMLMAQFHVSVATYWVIAGVSHAVEYYGRYRDRELRASQLEARLAQSQLEVLKAQLHPHFLFNTLHAISTLTSHDASAANRMIARLSELLRLTLEQAGTQEVRLRDEIEFLEKYLEIQQTRFEERLRVTISVDPTALDALVPSLVLQPLVENAIRHGIAPRREGGRVEIRAARVDGRVEVRVRDDGPGLGAAPSAGGGSGAGQGLGIANTRARLAHLYGPHHSFELRDHPEGGVEVTVAVPFREAEVRAH